MKPCGCDPLQPQQPVVTNPPGQTELSWRVATHENSLSRMLAVLANDPQPGMRALSRRGPDDPAVALLDALALVADTICFYTERVAAEGFLRTATELRSVRELARTVGYELRPGVAATADLAFTVDASAPEEVRVSAGTPVQTVPGQDELPQTFETAEDLVAHRAWNSIPGNATVPQEFSFGDTELWLRGTGLGVRDGDTLVVVGLERLRYGHDPAAGGGDRWDVRTVSAVAENPEGRDGWTHVRAHGLSGREGLVSERGVAVFTFVERASLFGYNAPEPSLLRLTAARLAGSSPDGTRWDNFGLASPEKPAVIDLDGDHPRLRGGDATRVEDCSWLLLRSPTAIELYRAVQVTPGGVSRFGLSGRVTHVTLDVVPNRDLFDRRNTVVLCQSRLLPAAEAPARTPVTGRVLTLGAADPPLPSGRRILVTDGHVSAPAIVTTCTVSGPVMTVSLDRELPVPMEPSTLRVLGNVVEATHGETVHEVLGSGDGRIPFLQLETRRGPLTYLRATTPSGARSTLDVRVDGVAWSEVPSLDAADADDRVFTVRHGDDGTDRVEFGDGAHGARPPTDVENITGSYRVGIGEAGAASAGQLTMLTHPPLGIASVRNPAPAHDWAPPETLAGARRNAPLHIRTLDRAVSRVDHEDFAAGFAGIGAARADEVWDGRTATVVVSVLGAGGEPVSDGLIADLATTLGSARDPGRPLRIMHGERLWFGVRFGLRCDLGYETASVVDAVRARLSAQLSHGARRFARLVTSAEVLVMVRAVSGVAACTMPELVDLPGWVPGASRPDPGLPGVSLLAALPARFEAADIRAAQIRGLATELVTIEAMS